jgi:hypothetical protein
MEFNVVKDYVEKYGGHFAKIIKINKIKYILIYFNNENDLMQAIYRSTIDELIWGKGLIMKNQDELIGTEGTYKKRIGVNRFKVPMQPTSKGEKSNLIFNLNNNFSERLEYLNKNENLPDTKDKQTEDKDKINKNKKRVVTTQGRREDSDNE